MKQLTAPDGQQVMMYDSNDPSVAVPPTLINSYSILTIPAYYRAMRFLSENLASFPRCIQLNDAPPAKPHPLATILSGRPNGYQTATVFWRTLFFSACHTNNGFARIDRQGNTPIALHNFLDGDIMPFRYDAGSGLMQWYYQRSTKTIFAGDDVLHLSTMSLDGMAGIDPVHLHTDTFQRAKTLDKYTTRFLMKGTVLKGSVEIPGSMTDEQFNEFRLRLRSNFRRAEAEDDVVILSDGAKLNNATMSSSDAQLIEQSNYSTKQISQITGVHPHYLFDDKDGRYNTNGEQAGIDVVKYAFRPWMELIDDELTSKLLSTADQSAGYKIRLNAAVITRGDTAVVTSAMVAQVSGGIRTQNEARKVLELPPDADPKSDQLERLGTTKPGSAAADANKPITDQGAGANQHSLENPKPETRNPNEFSNLKFEILPALQPIIAAAMDRVEQKTTKAFENAAKKSGQDRTIWANVFAEQQARFVADAFAPIVATIKAAGYAHCIYADPDLPQRYAAALRKRAATGEITPLADLLKSKI